MTRVVCAVGDPEADQGVAAAAADLSTRLELPLTLAHAREGSGSIAPLLGVPVPAAARPVPVDVATLARLARDLDTGGRDVRLELADGPATGLLQDLADEPGIWTVLGDSGRGPLAAAFAPGPSRRLISRRGGPLMIVPRHGGPPPEADGPVACLVADDGRAEAICQVAARVAPDAPIVLLHAADDAVRAARDPHLEALLAHCERLLAGRRVHARIVAGERSSALLAAARTLSARMLVLGGASHGPLSAPLARGTAHRVVAGAAVPVTIVRPAQAFRVRR